MMFSLRTSSLLPVSVLSLTAASSTNSSRKLILHPVGTRRSIAKSSSSLSSSYSSSSLLKVPKDSLHQEILSPIRTPGRGSTLSYNHITGTGSYFRKMSSEGASGGGGSGTTHDRSKCIFCRIVDGKENNEIYYQDDEIVVFQDIKPAAKYHLLVVPREHIRDSKSLVASQLGLLDRLIKVGNQVLAEQVRRDTPDVDPEQIQKQLGFHWPPFHTVAHLHLHVIAPSDQMGFIARAIFRPNSFWFVTTDYVRGRLEQMAAANTTNSNN